jgi:tRNA dimethylallyltransferase
VKVTFVVGSTASGKSAYALNQAIKNSAAIVNCDSIQVYQGLKIGSALPTQNEMSMAPHYLFSYVPKGQKMTAGVYCRDFFDLMDQVKDKYDQVYVVGGTGFYFQAIESGMYPEGAVNPVLKAQLEEQVKSEEGAEALYADFKSRDPEAAKKIFPKDHYRLVRAMELMLSHNKTLTDIKNEFAKQKRKFPWPLEKTGIQISREALQISIKKRTQKMLDSGLVDEVKALVQEGLADWPALQSVGYKETLDYLNGKIPNISKLEEFIIQGTLQLAKKQRTWFQRDREINWIG